MIFKTDNHFPEKASPLEMNAFFQNLSFDDIIPKTVAEAIILSADKYPKKTALTMLTSAEPDAEVISLSYAELKKEWVQACHLLVSLGVKVGDPIIFLSPPTLEGLIFFLAAKSIGAVAPVNPLLSSDVIAEIIDTLQATVVIGPSDAVSKTLAAKVTSCVNTCDSVKTIVAEGYMDGLSENKQLVFTQMRDQFPSVHLPENKVTAESIGAYFHTGGTTGTPKVAKLSQRNLMSGFVATGLPTSMDPDHITINGLPLFHIGGGLISVTRALVLGQTLIQLTSFGYRTPDLISNFWKIIVKHKVSQIITVPTVYQDILQTYKGEKTSITNLIAGASKLPTSLSKQYLEIFGMEPLEGYGMTECAGFCASNVTGLSVKPGYSGLVTPFHQIRVVKLNENFEIERDCEPNEVGLVVIRGAGVFLGYTDSEKDAKKFVIDPVTHKRWLNSEDLGRFDEESYLAIVGRAKDLIIRSGHNIDPVTIEETLLDSELIVDAAAVGMPDARTGELPIAFVQVKNGETIDELALREWCRAHIKEAGAVPVRIIELESLPRTAMNKIYKPELLRQATLLAVNEVTAIFDSLIQKTISVTVELHDSGYISIEIKQLKSLPQAEQDSVIKALSALGIDIELD